MQVPLQDEEFLKRYLEYCRARCSPRLTESAADLLENEYVAIRERGGSCWDSVSGPACRLASPSQECLGRHQKQGGSVHKHCPLSGKTPHAEHLPGVTTLMAAPGVPPLTRFPLTPLPLLSLTPSPDPE